jgi:hypothetical protein
MLLAHSYCFPLCPARSLFVLGLLLNMVSSSFARLELSSPQTTLSQPRSSELSSSSSVASPVNTLLSDLLVKLCLTPPRNCLFSISASLTHLQIGLLYRTSASRPFESPSAFLVFNPAPSHTPSICYNNSRNDYSGQSQHIQFPCPPSPSAGSNFSATPTYPYCTNHLPLSFQYCNCYLCLGRGYTTWFPAACQSARIFDVLSSSLSI